MIKQNTSSDHQLRFQAFEAIEHMKLERKLLVIIFSFQCKKQNKTKQKITRTVCNANKMLLLSFYSGPL